MESAAIEAFITAYFEGYEWVGRGKSGPAGAEWAIVLDIPALRRRLHMLLAEPHPGLGSGALREALAELDSISDLLHEHAVGLRYTNALRGISIGDLASRLDRAQVKLETVLSLSSPIEPPREHDKREALASYLLNISAPDWEYDKVISMAAEVLARPTPQASSEVRERLTDDEQATLRTLEVWKEQGRMLTDAELLLLKLLAPSRQGAGGK